MNENENYGKWRKENEGFANYIVVKKLMELRIVIVDIFKFFLIYLLFYNIFKEDKSTIIKIKENYFYNIKSIKKNTHKNTNETSTFEFD